jgi:hypothetical protein
MQMKQNRNIIKRFIAYGTAADLSLRLVLLVTVIFHYLVWVRQTNPLPDLDALAQYYYSVQNYLRMAMEVGNDYRLLRPEFFGNHYPHGPAVVAWLCAFFGFSAQILKEPDLINLLVIFPFVLCAEFFRCPRRHYFVIGICICFFPAAQICIKQFSLHGINVSYALLAFLCFRAGLAGKNSGRRNLWLLLFAFSFAFSAIAKHLGLLFFLNFLTAWAAWMILGRRRDKKAICFFILTLLLIFPFYNLSYQSEYINASVSHNPDMKTPVFMAWSLLLFVLLPLLSFLFRRFSRSRHLPHFFRGGLLLFLLSTLLVLMVVLDLFWPGQIFLAGYGLIICLLLWFDFSSIRGLSYLYILVNIVHLSMLFRSGAGSVSYVIFLPMLLMMVHTVSETRSFRFRLFLAVIVIIISNFFPDMKTMDRLFGYEGRNVYVMLFHSPHQNPLGWQRYCYGDVKDAVIAQWSQVNFNEPVRFVLENLGPHSSAQFVFFRNVLYSFPETKLMEFDGIYKEIYHEYTQKGEDAFVGLIEKMDVPLLLYTIADLPEERECRPVELDVLINAPHFSVENTHDDPLVFGLSESFIKWAERTGVLSENYECLDLPVNNPCVRSCVDKRLLAVEKGRNFGREVLDYVLEQKGK